MALMHRNDYPAALGQFFDRSAAALATQVPSFSPRPAEVVGQHKPPRKIRAVLWDLYGTLLGCAVGDLEAGNTQQAQLLRAGRTVIEAFGLEETLRQTQPDQDAADSLVRQYLHAIDEDHRGSEAKGIAYPEVVIENLWRQMLQTWKRNGYAPCYEGESLVDESDGIIALKMAWVFDGATQRTVLYDGAAECLETLKDARIVQGIISNAQFYTPLHLERLLGVRPETIFNEDLVFFSYRLGCSKPNPLAFEKAAAVLRRQGIEPEQTLYVGNDMLNDIWGAAQGRFATAWAAVDRTQLRDRKDDPRCEGLKPDMVVTNLERLAQEVVITV